ncbi:hypothetical protein ACF0H5_019702 [Mactra antiquata]
MQTDEPAADVPTGNNNKDIYEKRRNLIADGCKSISKENYASTSVRNNIKIDPVHNIRYCPIPKIGTTFWVRALTVLSSNGRLKSPFEIGRGNEDLLYWRNLPDDKKAHYLASGQSFIFVRDPYSRLYSGYEDKLFHVNLGFWQSLGLRIVRERVGTNSEDLMYGHDVTFPEFVKFILKQNDDNSSINVHFRPMHLLCDPCRFQYDFVGYLETFSQDANFLLTKWHKEFNDFTLDIGQFEKEAAIDTAKKKVKTVFSAKKICSDIKVPFKYLLMKTWRDLQIRGYLSKNVNFPYQGDVDNVTPNEFLDAIVKGLEQDQNWAAIKLQRNEALIQAYRQVPLEDMERLKQFFHRDCLLFGYDDRPETLFDRTKPLEHDFLYFEDFL